VRIAQMSSERDRYIIGAAPGQSLASFLPRLKDDPDIEFIDGSRRLAVVAMTHEHATALRAQYAGLLVIERDAPLTPFDR
jgi:hypothetical protein